MVATEGSTYSGKGLVVIANGAWITTVGMGNAAGPVFGGVNAEAFGWRWVFLLLAPPALLAAGMACWLLPESTPRKDVPGIGQCAVVGPCCRRTGLRDTGTRRGPGGRRRADRSGRGRGRGIRAHLLRLTAHQGHHVECSASTFSPCTSATQPVSACMLSLPKIHGYVPNAVTR